MKKMLIILLVLLISSITVMAEETEGSKVTGETITTQSLEITEELKGYVWSIPSSINFEEGVAEATVKVYSVHIPEGRHLNISVDSVGTKLDMTSNSVSGPVLSLKDKDDNNLLLGVPFLSVESYNDTTNRSDAPVIEKIKIKMTAHPFQAFGSYKGTISFKAVVS